MVDVELRVKLDRATLASLERVAAAEDQTIGQVIRSAINRDIRRRAKAKTPVRADERLVAPLRALLADDFAYATGWDDLQSRLRGKGYALHESGGGLILRDAKNGARICKGSELGYSYSALMRRYQRPFPGHRHAMLFDRVRAPSTPR